MSGSPAWSPLLATELRLHRRHGVLPAALLATAAWCAVLLVLPGHVRAAAVPWVLFVDLTALGFTFAPVLAVVERGNGVTAALAMTRLTAARSQLIRVGTFTTISVAAAAAVLAAGGVGRGDGAGTVLVGTVLTSVLFTVLAVAVLGRAVTMTAYLSRVPGVAAPLLIPALAYGTGLVRSPLLHASPATGALDLLHGRWSWWVAAWIAVWIAGLAAVVVRIGFDVEPRDGRSHTAGRAGRPVPTARTSATRSFAAVDARTLRSDRIALLMLVGVPIIALALRWFSTAGVGWVVDRHGVDVGSLLPLISTFVVVVHIPAMIGALAGLLFLEDRDAGLLPAVFTTRASLRALVTYRLGTCAAVAGGCVAVAAAVAGGTHPSGPAAMAATVAVAGATATLPAAVLAAFGRDRAHGMALVKMLGLPLYAPLAWWFVDGPAGWLLALSPTGWAARASWAGTTGGAVGFAAGGVILTVLVVAGMLRRMRML